MRPILAPRLETAAYVAIPYDVRVGFSNVINAYLAGNRRAARVGGLDVETARKALILSYSPPDTWNNKILDAAASTDQLRSFFDARRKLEGLDLDARAFVVALRRQQELVLDLGDCGRIDLRSKPLDAYWREEFVVMPGLGYPRPYMSLDPSIWHGVGNSDAVDAEGGCGLLPHPTSPWCFAVALSLLALDRGRLTGDLVPEVERVGHQDAKSMPFGSLEAVETQIRSLQAVLVLYAMQGMLLVAHANRRLITRSYELAYALDESARPHLDSFMAACNTIWSLRMHPLISYVANSLQTGSIDTFYGSKELLYRYGSRISDPVTSNVVSASSVAALGTSLLPGTALCSVKDSELRHLALSHALRDAFIRLNIDGSVAQCDGQNWGWSFAKTAAKSGSEMPKSPRPMSYIGAARLVAGMETITKHWSAVTSQLGWSDLKADVGLVQAHGADFILTDGLGYSDKPAAGILGLRPVIATGNVKVAAISVIVEEKFNAAGDGKASDSDIIFSTMVAIGQQGMTGSASHLERLYLPAGMWLGEPDVRQLHAERVELIDIGRDVVRHFSGQQEQYTVMMYYDGNNPNPANGAYQTSWDPTAYGTRIADVQASWLKMMGPSGKAKTPDSKETQLVDAATTRYMSRLDRQQFLHRFPVRMARPQFYELYNSIGSFIRAVAFNGRVLFDDEITTTVNTADVEIIINCAPPTAATGVATIDDALTRSAQVS